MICFAGAAALLAVTGCNERQPKEDIRIAAANESAEEEQASSEEGNAISPSGDTGTGAGAGESSQRLQEMREFIVGSWGLLARRGCERALNFRSDGTVVGGPRRGRWSLRVEGQQLRLVMETERGEDSVRVHREGNYLVMDGESASRCNNVDVDVR